VSLQQKVAEALRTWDTEPD